MKPVPAFIAALFLGSPGFSPTGAVAEEKKETVPLVAEVVVFGATPAGIAAAIAARREGAGMVILADSSAHVGGRFAETIGFGEIQRMPEATVGGLWTELRAKVDAHYGKVTQTPEPHVMERLLRAWLEDEGGDGGGALSPGSGRQGGAAPRASARGGWRLAGGGRVHRRDLLR
ncbi:MAG: FAD-dependent oxidoreductase [Verrucomicrobiales bacterium]